MNANSPLKSFFKLYFNGKTIFFFWIAGFFLPAINATVFSWNSSQLNTWADNCHNNYGMYQNWEVLNTIIISYPLTFLKIIAVSVVVIVSPSSISACLNHRSIWLSVMWEPSLCRSLPNEAKDWNCSLKVPSGSWKK